MGSIALFGFLLIFAFMGIPIAFSIGLSSALVIYLFDVNSPLFQPRSIIMAINSYPLLAIPLFILGGDLMSTGGLSRRLIGFAEALVGSFKANLAYVTVLASCFFAAISGSGPATVAAIGSNIIPEMEKRGYTRDYATGVTTVSGMIGVMIPPSIPFIVYGLAAEESVSRLFLAGIGPGMLFALGFAVTARILYKKTGFQIPTVPFNLKNLGAAFKDAFFALLAPVIVLGGIYGGFFSPTEAAAFICFYALIVGVFIYKEINLKNFFETVRKSTVTAATCMTLIAFAATFARVLSLEQTPVKLASLLYTITDNPVVLLLIINGILLLVGMFMDTTASIIILTPILAPVVKSFGIDPILFGVIMTCNLAVGFCTPPLGINLFVATGVADLKLERVIRAVGPYFITMAIMLLLVNFVPAISLTLPKLVFGH